MSVTVERRAGIGGGPSFSPVTVILMLLVGVFAFSALIVLSAYAPDLRSGDDAGAHALSRSAVGYAGAVELMQAGGRTALVRRGVAGTHNGGLLIVTPSPGQGADDIENLAFTGPILIVLPKWQVVADITHRGWVRNAGAYESDVWVGQLLDGLTEEAAADGDNPAPPESAKDRARRRLGMGEARAHVTQASGAGRHRLSLGRWADGPALPAPGPINSWQTISGPDWVPMVVDEAGRAILVRHSQRDIYVLADPDLLNNHGLKDLATARSALAIIDAVKAPGDPVFFDVTLNGFNRGRNLLRLMFDPPFLAVTLCLAGALGLMGFHATARFGPSRRAERVFAFGKEALADNSAELIRLARREHRMGGRYAALIRQAVAKAVGAPRDLTADALTAFLDRLGAQRQTADTLSALTEAANNAKDRTTVTAIAQRLHRWRVEMTRESR